MSTKKVTERITITPPKIESITFHIRGTAPYVQNKFAAKSREMMRAAQEAGSRSKKGKSKDPKDFTACYEQAMHVAEEGWKGIPAPAFRNAMISACRLVGYKMTHAKLSVFVAADGIDADDGTPLVKITKGEPEYLELAVRNATGVADLRARPMWRHWDASVKIQYDTGQFSAADVMNLMLRVGLQVGIGEGRHDSKRSAGMGWGTFEILDSRPTAADDKN